MVGSTLQDVEGSEVQKELMLSAGGQAQRPYHIESEAHMPPAEAAAAEAAYMRCCCTISLRVSSSRAKYSTSARGARPPLLWIPSAKEILGPATAAVVRSWAANAGRRTPLEKPREPAMASTSLCWLLAGQPRGL